MELILSSDENIMKQQLLQFMDTMVVTGQNEVKEFLKEDPLFFLFHGNAVECQEDAAEMLGCNKVTALTHSAPLKYKGILLWLVSFGIESCRTFV